MLTSLASFGLLALSLEPGDQPIPLHYNIYFGIDSFGPWYAYYYLPAAGAALLLANSAIGLVLLRNEKLLARLLTSAGAFVTILIFLGTLSAVRQLL